MKNLAQNLIFYAECSVYGAIGTILLFTLAAFIKTMAGGEITNPSLNSLAVSFVGIGGIAGLLIKSGEV